MIQHRTTRACTDAEEDDFPKADTIAANFGGVDSPESRQTPLQLRGLFQVK